MPKYRCRGQFLLTVKPEGGGKPTVRLCQPGDEIEYDGLPSENLQPLDAAAKSKRKEAEKHFEQERRNAALRSSSGGNDILAALVEALTRVQGGGAASKRSYDDDHKTEAARDTDHMREAGVPVSGTGGSGAPLKVK